MVTVIVFGTVSDDFDKFFSSQLKGKDCVVEVKRPHYGISGSSEILGQEVYYFRQLKDLVSSQAVVAFLEYVRSKPQPLLMIHFQCLGHSDGELFYDQTDEEIKLLDLWKLWREALSTFNDKFHVNIPGDVEMLFCEGHAPQAFLARSDQLAAMLASMSKQPPLQTIEALKCIGPAVFTLGLREYKLFQAELKKFTPDDTLVKRVWQWPSETELWGENFHVALLLTLYPSAHEWFKGLTNAQKEFFKRVSQRVSTHDPAPLLPNLASQLPIRFGHNEMTEHLSNALPPDRASFYPSLWERINTWVDGSRLQIEHRPRLLLNVKRTYNDPNDSKKVQEQALLNHFGQVLIEWASTKGIVIVLLFDTDQYNKDLLLRKQEGHVECYGKQTPSSEYQNKFLDKAAFLKGLKSRYSLC